MLEIRYVESLSNHITSFTFLSCASKLDTSVRRNLIESVIRLTIKLETNIICFNCRDITYYAALFIKLNELGIFLLSFMTQWE